MIELADAHAEETAPVRGIMVSKSTAAQLFGFSATAFKKLLHKELFAAVAVERRGPGKPVRASAAKLYCFEEILSAILRSKRLTSSFKKKGIGRYFNIPGDLSILDLDNRPKLQPRHLKGMVVLSQRQAGHAVPTGMGALVSKPMTISDAIGATPSENHIIPANP